MLAWKDVENGGRTRLAALMSDAFRGMTNLTVMSQLEPSFR
jgi:hypothetical protein